jgi:hypothetical protein
MRFVITVALVALAIVGCDGANANDSRRRVPVATRTKANAQRAGVAEAADGLPAPKTLVTFQQKYTKAFSGATHSKPFYEVVNQWIFQPDENDDSIICVEDGEHCITLTALKEQLNRPASDPLGIR